jgi:hypothetical protein
MSSEESINRPPVDQCIIRYTREEIYELIEALPKLTGSFVVGHAGTLIASEEFTSFVFLDPILDPKDIILPYTNYHKVELNLLFEIRELIYYIPLHRVPLYMLSHPDIVAWRLRLAK